MTLGPRLVRAEPEFNLPETNFWQRVCAAVPIRNLNVMYTEIGSTMLWSLFYVYSGHVESTVPCGLLTIRDGIRAVDALKI